jgi:hypothetical protein
MKWHIIFVYAFLAFALFLGYGIIRSIYLQDYQLMEIVADVGAVLICLDLAASTYFLKIVKHPSEKTAPQVPKVHRVVKVTRKVGHFGIMLIICGWVVPML